MAALDCSAGGVCVCVCVWGSAARECHEISNFWLRPWWKLAAAAVETGLFVPPMGDGLAKVFVFVFVVCVLFLVKGKR